MKVSCSLRSRNLNYLNQQITRRASVEHMTDRGEGINNNLNNLVQQHCARNNTASAQGNKTMLNYLNYLNQFVRYFLDHRAEYLWGDAVEALAIGNNTYTTHLYGAGREENTLVLRGKEALRTGFAAEKDDGVEFRR